MFNHQHQPLTIAHFSIGDIVELLGGKNDKESLGTGTVNAFAVTPTGQTLVIDYNGIKIQHEPNRLRIITKVDDRAPELIREIETFLHNLQLNN